MEARFIAMYDEYFDDVYRYIYTKTGNKWDAEDVVSETFRKAYEKRACLVKEPNPKAWLLTVARNTAIDHYRKKKGIPIGDRLDFYPVPVPFSDPLEQWEERECLKKTLLCLPPEEMEIINLRYFANMRFKEIAAILQVQENFIRVKSGRIIKKVGLIIKKCLGGTE